MKFHDAPAPHTDQILKREVVEIILRDLQDPESDLIMIGGFEQWARNHKRLIVQLFGGGQAGIQSISRIIAWVRRELEDRRRPQPEHACLIAELLSGGVLPVIEPGLARHWANLNDMLTSAMIDKQVADILMEPLPSDRVITPPVRAKLLDLLA